MSSAVARRFSGGAQIAPRPFAHPTDKTFGDVFSFQPNGLTSLGQRVTGLSAVEQSVPSRHSSAAMRRPTVMRLVLSERAASLRLPSRATTRGNA